MAPVRRGRRRPVVSDGADYPLGLMSFGPAAIRGASGGLGGAVDYRLLRQSVIADYRKKRLAQHEVCDAHPELVRAARELGEATQLDCPICEDAKVVLVTYVFGPNLPAFGRCISTKGELAKLDRRPDQLAAYVVEVCPSMVGSLDVTALAAERIVREIMTGLALRRRG